MSRKSRTFLATAVAASIAVLTASATPPALAVAAPFHAPPMWQSPAIPAVPAAPVQGTLDPLTSPSAPGTQATVAGPSPATVPHIEGGHGSARVPAAAPPANSSGSGDFAVLPGSSTGSWGVTGQTGGFTWSYPLQVRNAPAGPTPQLALSYDSTRVDGLTSATNNQASVVGDGWGLAGAGRVTQRFTPCTDQGISGSYDLCGNQGGQRVSVSFGGRSSELVKDAATGTWHLANDDGTRVEYLTGSTNGTFDGGYWKLTDPAGVQYFFGMNRLPGWSAGNATTNSADTVPVGAADPSQPCAAASFAASLCQQAYGWNLDYVLDPSGNTQAFYYAQDTNYYKAQNGTGSILPYVRASRLNKVDYGMRSGAELTAQAPLHVLFTYDGRCTGVDCSKGNDIPTGLSCPAAGPCTVYSPTFYTDQRLTAVQAETLVGASYQGADKWTLAHSMPDPGDGTKPALWLGSLTHSGIDTSTGGSALTDPATVFSGQTLQNRVWVYDGVAPLNRFRLTGIKSPTGATTGVSYYGADCTPSSLPASPQSNTRRCFPQWWTPTTPIVQAARMDWFHVYPVQAVTMDAGPGGAGSLTQTTTYTYIGNPAWKYPEPHYRTDPASSKMTWSVLAGWSQVKAATAGSTVTTVYLRGLDGTPSDTAGGTNASTVTASDGTIVTDSPWFAGRILETQTTLGSGGSLLKATATLPWASAPTATGAASLGGPTARHTGTGRIWTKSAVAAGWRTTSTTTVFDALGRPKAASDQGDTGTAADDICTTTDYATGTAKNLLTLPAATSVYANACNTDGTPAGNLLKSAQTMYDGATSALPGTNGYAEPTRGLATATRAASAVSGSAATAWQSGPAIAYDALGRPTTSTDTTTGTARTTTTAYTPATGPATSTTSTNALGWTSTVTYDAVRGNTLKTTDPNGSVTENTYDASGRTTAAWDPLRPRATNATPTTATTYTISQTTPSWIRTTRVNNSSGTTDTYTIYDGLGRPRQTQTPSLTGGTVATDTFYNASGAKASQRNPYYVSSNPDGTLILPTLAVPSSTLYDYDPAGRITRTRNMAWDNQLTSETDVSYTGTDTTTTTGTGTTAAATATTDAAGRLTAKTTWHGTSPTGAADTTRYSYDRLGTMNQMTDPAGNAWTWTTDPLGRETSRTDPDTGTTATAYDTSGRKATTTDAAGTVTSYTYDTLDRVTNTSTALAGQQAKTLTTTTWDTEKKGQPASSTRYNGPNQDQAVTTDYSSYNAAYQPGDIKLTLPAAFGTLAATYDTTIKYGAAGLPTISYVPAAGPLPREGIQNTYNALDLPSGLISQYNVRYATNVGYNNLNAMGGYDQNDTSTGTAGADTMGATTVQYTWDATTGNLTTAQAWNSAKGTTTDLGKTDYSYDPTGRLTSTTTAYPTRTSPPPADRQCYTYDWANRLSQVWATSAADCTGGFSPTKIGGPAPYAQAYEYNATSDRSKATRYNADGTIAATEDYTYGNGGPHRLTSIKRTTGSTTTTDAFGYDPAGRMTNRAGQALAYTPDGKIATATGTSTIPANPNPAAPTGSPKTAGTDKTGTRYYTADGTLAGITDGTGTTALIGSTTVYAPTTGPTTATRSFTFAGRTVAQRTATTAATGSATAFITADPLNTALTITGPTTGGGTNPIPTTTRRTDPYGLTRGPTMTGTGNQALTAAPAAATGPGTNGANPAAFSAATGYLGGTADTATGLTHLGARDYDPVLGAFTAPDPVLDLKDARNYSPYAYANNEPVNTSDPTGLWIGLALADDGMSWHSPTANVTPGQWHPAPVYPEYLNPFHPLRTYNPGTYVNNSYAGTYYPPAPAYTAPPPPPAPGNTHTVSAQRTTTPAPDPYLAQHKYEIAATALALVAGAALCAATAGLGCLIGAAVLGGALTTTGYAADTNWTAPPDDLATHFLEDTAWGLAGGAAGKAVGTIAGRLGGAARGTSALGRDAAESCLNSFTSDTPVLMEDGTRKPIAEVRVGDRVIATDPEKGTTAAEDVQALIRHSGPHDMVDITLVDGSTLHSTDGHPIWNATTKTFTDASDLKIGEQIQTTGGALLPIAGLKRYKAELTAYNLQIDKIHTYYAGETPILVHNSCSLYQKLGPDGEHLKYGISNNPSTRYTAAQLNGGSLKILATGERRDMLALERDLHSTLPIGPEEGQSIYVQIQIKKGLLPPPY